MKTNKKSTLRLKLIVSFCTVIVITGSIATFMGYHLIDKGIVREAQSKVTLDLNTAQLIYDQSLKDILNGVTYTAQRKLGIIMALRDNNRKLLSESLFRAFKESGFDILTITDKEGRVVLRAHNPGVYGDSKSDDEFVKLVMLSKKPCSGTQIVFQEDLLKESKSLADQAYIKLIPTPRGRPYRLQENTSGMILKAAVPLLDDNNEMLGVMYGGVVLNKNYQMVDKIKNVVFKNVKYREKDVGTATIFQDCFRISTNVTLRTGGRAIGTIISNEVYERVVEQGEVWTDRAFVVNDWYLSAYSPIKDLNERVIGILYVGMLEARYNDMKKNSLLMFFGVIITGIILSFAVSYMLAHVIVKPVLRLKQAVEALAEGNFDFDIIISSTDEIGSLERSFDKVRQELKQTYNKLQGEIEAADEDLKKAYKELREKQELLVQKERLASMGQLSAGVAHEINNPIGTIVLFSHTLLKQFPEGDPVKGDLEVIVREAMRCKNIVRDLLNFARQSRVSKQPTDIATLIEEVLAILKPEADVSGINMKTRFDKNLPPVMIDKAQIQQVLVNLIKNSIDAISSLGEIIVTLQVREKGDEIVISIQDNGCGIGRENLSKLFTPFFTTKDMGKGTGLGLAIAYGIIKMHSGNIAVESEVGKGTTFVISLPVHAMENVKEEIGDSIYTIS